MTASDVADAVAAMKERAVDYVTKPFDVQEMVTVVDRIDERRRLVRELEEARAQLAARRASDLLVGRSPAHRRAARADEASPTATAAVLLIGESGTGKELVARMIHERSAAPRQALRRRQLRGDPRVADRGGAVRARAGRLHRGVPAP